MSNMKTELEAENARLREENEALRDVLAAIGEGETPLPLDGADMDKFHRVASRRMDMTAVYARGAAKYRDDYIVAVLRGKAETLRKEWQRPLRYVPETPAIEGTVTAPPADAPYAQVIRTAPDAGNGMPGPLCPASHPMGECRRLDSHPMPHRTMDGYEWDAPYAPVLNGAGRGTAG